MEPSDFCNIGVKSSHGIGGEMDTELIGECETATTASDAMLLDCYMELIAYTGYVIKQVKDDAPAYEGVAKVYEDLVERSRRFAASTEFSEDDWLEGLFPVCAYIDEALLCSDWLDRDKWERDQLQRKYFNTTAAGWEFYQRLDNLKDAAVGLRAVYEFCLALGFKGRYYRTSDIGRIEDVQYTQLKGVTENIELVYPETPFPDAYEPEMAAKKRERKKFSFFFPAAILLPLLVFAGLYFLFDRLLDQTVAHYFGTRF